MSMNKRRLITVATILGLIILITACTGDVDISPSQDEADNTLENEQNESEPVFERVGYVRPENREAAMNYQAQPGEIVVYTDPELKAFLAEPSIDLLIQTSHQIWVFRINEFAYSDNDVIEAERLFPYHRLMHSNSGGFRIGNWPLYTEFFDFISDTENFVEALANNHVHDEAILNIAVFEHLSRSNAAGPVVAQPSAPGTYPRMCIWVQTEAGHYILEDRFFQGSPLHDTTWTYRFFDLERYRRMYG